jgi:predicted Zn-dependent protease
VALVDAIIARATGQLDAAALTLQKAIQSSPDDAVLWRALGIVQIEQGQAMLSIQRSLRLDPKQEDLSRLSANLSMQAAQAELPGMPSMRGMQMPGVSTPESLMPKVPGIPAPGRPGPRQIGDFK